MADVPAVTDPPSTDTFASEEPVSEPTVQVNRFDDTFDSYRKNDVASGFLQLPWMRQIGLIVGFASVITFAVLLILWSQDPDYRPLYSNLEPSEVSGIIAALEVSGITFTVEPGSGMVLVPVTELHEARMEVAAADVLAPRDTGYRILDVEQPLGTSQFMEAARYQRAIEGELSKTIASLKNVRRAKVLLAIPKQSVFVRDNRKPSAAVFVEIIAGRDLERHQVKSVMHLVSYSVPEMHKSDVTVVDQHGNLLSDLEDDAGIGETKKQFEFARTIEEELRKKIERILKPILGETKFNAQVSADVDFTWVEETQEVFNPDLPAVRSEVTRVEINTGTTEGGVPGALSNQPSGGAGAPETAIGQDGEPYGNPTRKNTHAQRNYELDRTISHTRRPVGEITRLTIAVVLDDQRLINAEDGEVTIAAWDEASLQRLSQLIRDAVGFSASRADRVTVINESFLPVEPINIEDDGFWTEAWFTGLAKQFMVGMLVVFLTLFVLKPVLNMLAGPSAEDRMKELLAEQELERLAEQELEQEEEMMQETVTLSGGEELLLPGPGDLFARQLDAIRSLVDENPSRVAQVVKEWAEA